MKRFVAALVVLVVVGTVAWKLWHRNDVASPATAIVAKDRDLPPNSVLQVRPQPAPAATSTPAAAAVPAFARPKVSDDLAQYRAGKNFADLYARLQARPDSAESLYLKAAIYARCSVRAKSGAKPTPDERATQRQQFIASIAPGSPDQQQRIDAYDRMAVDPCDGLDLGVYDANALQRMLTAAADAGDVSAQAWLLADQAEHRTPAELGKPTKGIAINAGNLDQVRAVLASGDPDAIMYLRGTLSSTLEQGELRLDGQSFDPGAMHTALQLLACDAGAECGPDSQALLQACALRGQCAASNLYDYAYYYGESPNQSQLVDAYRQAFSRMLSSGDFSGFALSPIQPFPDSSTTYYGDSRP
jgi:hypothetical protein